MQAALSNFRAALAARSAAAASSVHATLERRCCIGAAFAEMDDINRAVRWCAEQSAAASRATPPTVARGAAASRQTALTAHLNESEARCVPRRPCPDTPGLRLSVRQNSGVENAVDLLGQEQVAKSKGRHAWRPGHPGRHPFSTDRDGRWLCPSSHQPLAMGYQECSRTMHNSSA